MMTIQNARFEYYYPAVLVSNILGIIDLVPSNPSLLGQALQDPPGSATPQPLGLAPPTTSTCPGIPLQSPESPYSRQISPYSHWICPLPLQLPESAPTVAGSAPLPLAGWIDPCTSPRIPSIIILSNTCQITLQTQQMLFFPPHHHPYCCCRCQCQLTDQLTDLRQTDWLTD